MKPKQTKIEAYSYVDKRTGDHRADITHVGDTDILLSMAVTVLLSILDDVSVNKSAYNLLLLSAMKQLAIHEYEQEETE